MAHAAASHEANGGPPHAEHRSQTETVPVWLYWEGPYPDWIRACHHTIAAHVPGARLLTPETFAALRDRDRDIDLDRLAVPHRADYVRAFLLARYGGLWIDSDCLVMQSLEPLLELLGQHAFLGHRERSGWVSNGFIGARPGSRIAAALYERVCQILRSRRPLAWGSLGSHSLTAVIEANPGEWYEIPCEWIQPICVSEPAAFFAREDSTVHETHYDPRSLCYMLSNTEVKKYRNGAENALLEPDTFFSHLLNRSLGQDAQSRDGEATSANGTVPYEQLFRGFVEAYRKIDGESLSGPGSTLSQTRQLRARLPLLLEDLGVCSLLDAPCGDFNWMKEVVLGIEEYTGVDVVGELIAQNRRRYARPSRRFLRLDITRDPLPVADCILSRDCLVHLSFDDAFQVLRNFRRSGARFLLMTTFAARRPNEDTSLGAWRPLNFELPPFSFPAPERTIDEKCSEVGGAYADKTLGLWRLQELPV